MGPEILVRLAMSVAILVGLWMQLPRVSRQLEERGRESLRDRGAQRRKPEEEQAIIDRHVAKGRRVLFISFGVMVVLAWVLPLPF